MIMLLKPLVDNLQIIFVKNGSLILPEKGGGAHLVYVYCTYILTII